MNPSKGSLCLFFFLSSLLFALTVSAQKADRSIPANDSLHYWMQQSDTVQLPANVYRTMQLYYTQEPVLKKYLMVIRPLFNVGIPVQQRERYRLFLLNRMDEGELPKEVLDHPEAGRN